MSLPGDNPLSKVVVSKDNVIAIIAFIVSIPFQLLSRQVFLISSIVLAVFLILNLIYVWAKGIDIKRLFDDTVLKSVASFWIGSTIVLGVSFCYTSFIEHRTRSERESFLASNVSQSLLCDIVVGKLMAENIEPTYEWLDSMGVINESHCYDYICGSYYIGLESSDYAKARKHFKIAAEDNPLAAYLYGECLYLGLADIPEEEEGVRYFRYAAEHEVLDAQFRLFGHYALSGDIGEAEKWYKRIIHINWARTFTVSLSNSNLFDSRGSDSALETFLKPIMTHIMDVRNRTALALYSIQMSRNRPYAAMQVIDEFIDSIPGETSKAERQRVKEQFAQMKYNVFANSGNYVEARKIYKKYSSSFDNSGMLKLTYSVPMRVVFDFGSSENGE